MKNGISRKNWSDKQKREHSKKLNEMLRKIYEIERRKEYEVIRKEIADLTKDDES